MTESLRGSITSVGFASGHRFVVGHWRASPIGPFSDVMWADPGGRRVLVASPPVAEFVRSVYPFEEVRPFEVGVEAAARHAVVSAGDISLSYSLSWWAVNFPPRPRWITATAENWISRRLLGVQTYGVSPTGVSEWYRTRSLRWITAASASLNGADLGPMSELDRPLGFGFTDPPRRPCRVELRVDLKR
ncbi:MAG: hypothetical protein OXF64_08755 [bacterium]|nr:hypothetical protein [bacterium]